MTIQKLLQSAKQLLADAKQLTPAIAQIVNDARALAHVTGELTPEIEAALQNSAQRFHGYLTFSKLSPLPTAGPDGEVLKPLPALTPSATAVVEPETQAQKDYNAGFEAGKVKAELAEDASADFKAGYLAGVSAGNGTAGTSPVGGTSSAMPLSAAENIPPPPEGSTGVALPDEQQPPPPAPEEEVKQ